MVYFLTYGTRFTRLAEITTGILCVSFPELGLLLRGGCKRKSSMEASTGIREGRYREQNAVFKGLRHSLWTSGKRGGGGSDGVEYEHIELDEVRLINGPANVVSVESGQPVPPTPSKSPGDVEVTKEVRVDSASIV